MSEPANKADVSKLTFIKLPTKSLSSSDSAALLAAIKRVEKRTFPSHEAFDFDNELSKKKTNLCCAYERDLRETGAGTGAGAPGPNLVGYVVFVRAKAVRIHKVAVVENRRGMGIGKWMLDHVLGDLRKGGSSLVDLWVDVDREAARRLYSTCGFMQKELIENYYCPGRDAIRMEKKLLV